MISSEKIRQLTIEFSCNTGAGHLAPSLSTVELITVLFNEYLTFNKTDPLDESRDRFILSKGHGTYAYYILLNKLGFIPDWELEKFNTPESTLKGCLTENPNYMIEASTGSLGHGLPLAVGMALSFKINGKNNKVICMVGDGEMQEGSNFEAMMLAHRFKLNNLLVIVDANELQAMGRVEDVAISNDRLARVMSAFIDEGFYDIDGHDEVAIRNVYSNFYKHQGDNFNIMFARTIKGKGLPILEGSIKHHYRCPTEDGFKPGEE
ncbi:transketolase [Pseudoalteromonas rubra]|uniref:Transketolase n=1 Tax=Pseudoalteromonas rubra TaxID=43658 RepID=A0A5S3WJY3_9GAMM|nr:transketolase [Pseudoalteromonas rubra]TMP27112.1 transketolase [Pseudoalteromonas rubra]TMP36123.1 transketolase [Pseudoalteromonas rubra]